MVHSRTQPNFRRFADLQSEPAKGSLDPRRKVEPSEPSGAPKKRTTLSISQYQDPRDELDHERHALLAKARLEKDGGTPPDASDE